MTLCLLGQISHAWPESKLCITGTSTVSWPPIRIMHELGVTCFTLEMCYSFSHVTGNGTMIHGPSLYHGAACLPDVVLTLPEVEPGKGGAELAILQPSVRVEVAAPVSRRRARSLSMAKHTIRITMGAKVRVGGVDGFEADVDGTYDMADSSGVLNLRHPGGWRPLKGTGLAELITTPPLTGSMILGQSPELQLQIQAATTFGYPLNILPGAIVAQPGAALLVHLQRRNGSTPFEYWLEFNASLLFGDAAAGLPLLHVHGNISHLGDAVLNLATDAPWAPLPTVFPGLIIPQLFGRVELSAGAGAIRAWASHAPFGEIDMLRCPLLTGGASCAFDAPGMLLFRNVRANASILASSRQDSSASFSLSLSGLIRAGGADGINASFAGTFTRDAATGDSAQLTITHNPGGDHPSFKPFGAAWPSFTIPACTGTIAYGTSPYLTLSVLADTGGELSLGQLSLKKASTWGQQSGPTLGLWMTKATKTSQPQWSVVLMGRVCLDLGGLALPPPAPPSPPTICFDANATGSLSPLEVTVQGRYTGGDIKPFKHVLPQLNQDAFVLHATAATPLEGTVTYRHSPLLMQLLVTGKMSIDLSAELMIPKMSDMDYSKRQPMQPSSTFPKRLIRTPPAGLLTCCSPTCLLV